MQDEVIAKVNEKLQADGVNIEVKLQRIPWDAWEQKTQLMILSLIHIYCHSINLVLRDLRLVLRRWKTMKKHNICLLYTSRCV